MSGVLDVFLQNFLEERLYSQETITLTKSKEPSLSLVPRLTKIWLLSEMIWQENILENFQKETSKAGHHFIQKQTQLPSIF